MVELTKNQMRTQKERFARAGLVLVQHPRDKFAKEFFPDRTGFDAWYQANSSIGAWVSHAETPKGLPVGQIRAILLMAIADLFHIASNKIMTRPQGG